MALEEPSEPRGVIQDFIQMVSEMREVEIVRSGIARDVILAKTCCVSLGIRSVEQHGLKQMRRRNKGVLVVLSLLLRDRAKRETMAAPFAICECRNEPESLITQRDAVACAYAGQVTGRNSRTSSRFPDDPLLEAGQIVRGPGRAHVHAP